MYNEQQDDKEASPPVIAKPTRMTARKIHRWLGIGATILFLSVSVTGVFLQIEQIFGAEEATKEALAAARSPLSVATLPAPHGSGLDRARRAVLAKFGDQPVASLDWQIKGPVQYFVFHLDGAEPTRVDVDATSGAVIEAGPDGEDWLLRLHTGEIVGDGGKVLGLGWGLALIAMLVTGVLAYLNMYRARQKGSAKYQRGWRRYFWMVPLLLLVAVARPDPARAAPKAEPPEASDPAQPPAASSAVEQGWSYNPDAGFIYQAGDARLTLWGFAERALDPDGPDYFRRFRQGAELDLPRLSDSLRPAIVYEVDLTNTGFFGDFGASGGKLSSRNFENLFVALQDPDDPGKFRLLAGENTHILSREDNLSSGNLATVNRSLILEEHGSVGSFGSQFGVEFQKALSAKLTLQLAALDNRGTLNSDKPRYKVGNALAGKVILTPVNAGGRKLSLGAAIDRTGDIGDRVFTLAGVIGSKALGGVRATGTKLTGEGDVVYTFPLLGRPTTLEAEVIYSRFSGSHSDVGGGYAMVQFSIFDSKQAGDLDLFVRYDLVSLGIDNVDRRATQEAFRSGINYNLPNTEKLVSLHVEYGHNTVSGPPQIVPVPSAFDEFRAVLRISLQRYTRH